MKTKIILLASLFLAHSNLFSQENELPNEGNVGIGTTAPTEKLDVRGGARIDSTLTVGDSLLITNSARVGEDLRVSGNAHIEGNLNVNGGITLPNGPLNLEYLLDTVPAEDIQFLTFDEYGNVKKGGNLKSIMYAETAYPPCKDGNDGYTTSASPIWLNGPGKLYTSSHCVPDAKVGIGINNPTAKLHIKTNESFYPLTKAILVEDRSGDKMFQVNTNGLVYAREIKVNLDSSWPDYVFDSTYALIPLEDLKTYIAENNHLPNVPSASEIKENGINVAETDKMLMEKVEELTLYMIQLQEQLKVQQELLNQQQQVIQELKEASKN